MPDTEAGRVTFRRRGLEGGLEGGTKGGTLHTPFKGLKGGVRGGGMKGRRL